MADNTPVRRRQVPAVTRAVAILRQLGKSPEPLGVNHLARDLGLVPSTCLHILRVLTEEGLVSFDSHTKRYAIDVGILPIARSAIRRNGFATLIEPRLTRLSRDFGVTAVATQLADSEHMVVVALSDASLPFRLQVDLGSRFPALISATGRCHAAYNLAALPEAELRARFAKLSWDDPPAYEDWRQDVRVTRRDGYAIDRGRYIGGVSILAVPFLNRTARMTHSIVAIGISERIASIGIQSIVDAMQTVRYEVETLLIGPAGGDG